MLVRVINKKFGIHEVGTELEMCESTAKAVAKHGHVELLDGDKKSEKKGVKK
jgi:hypothetical protein